MIQPETITGRFNAQKVRREEKNAAIYVDTYGIAHVPLSRGYEAIVDACDVELVREFCWSLATGNHGLLYAKGYVPMHLRERWGVKMLNMHRLILNTDAVTEIDHKDRNGLNCRRGNLRPCTRSQNGANRIFPKGKKAPYRGVFQYGKRWRAALQVQRKLIHLGMFDTPEMAANAYDQAAQKHYGEFAVLNNLTPRV
jgi:hypothetical protein